ncbi:hypothetical protein CIL03_16250 [Virgibacillus indicus]|uniref:Sigma-54 factor interaction domain-containing protein n=1 Tax=Virgibacillus indicus TaxID=2024554 RepID=A0A265N860_9BACI|nr:sigma 54-interacting transcriptional regulator [Virgibacillus indicus]OZU87639.1 hypothetical protein CIL03_16250 [Virgibacillus indicus]
MRRSTPTTVIIRPYRKRSTSKIWLTLYYDTGAVDREGLFELADGGILFLDEINSLPMSLQAKLLRVIQDQKIRRVGDVKEFKVEVKLIVASNTNPKELLNKNKIREDLYYRLSVLNVELSPLRKRKSDIPILVDHFIEDFNDVFGKLITGISDGALDKLKNYSWPGNIRELRNVIERVMNKKDTGLIEEDDIRFNSFNENSHLINKNYSYPPLDNSDTNTPFREIIEKTEIKIIKNELENTSGNISKAARNLDMPQQTMSNKIKKYQLEKYILNIKLLNNE